MEGKNLKEKYAQAEVKADSFMAKAIAGAQRLMASRYTAGILIVGVVVLAGVIVYLLVK